MIFQYSTEKISNKRKVQLADVYELQCQVYKKELIKQDKEIERLDLQIKLLKKLEDAVVIPGSSVSFNSPYLNQLFASMY
jgi:hypothetical protein